jgi:hypothetical protein
MNIDPDPESDLVEKPDADAEPAPTTAVRAITMNMARPSFLIFFTSASLFPVNLPLQADRFAYLYFV